MIVMAMDWLEVLNCLNCVKYVRSLFVFIIVFVFVIVFLLVTLSPTVNLFICSFVNSMDVSGTEGTN